MFMAESGFYAIFLLEALVVKDCSEIILRAQKVIENST